MAQNKTQVLQRGNHVSVNSKGERKSTPMPVRSSSGSSSSRGAGVREYTTGLDRREKKAGLR